MTQIRDDGIPAPGSASSGPAKAAEQAGSAAGDVKDHTVEAAADVKDQAGTELANLQGEARQEARTLAHEARGRVADQADDAARKLASTISGAGGELRSMAERSDQPDGPVTGAVRQLADRSESLAQRLETGGYRGVADDLSRLGRNKPGLFLLAAGVAGFAIGRVLRNTDTGSLTGAVKGESDTTAPASAEPATHVEPVFESPSATYAPPVAVGAPGGVRPGSR
jgi:hypothetical protein